jgi:hypothetical protein
MGNVHWQELQSQSCAATTPPRRYECAGDADRARRNGEANTRFPMEKPA